MTQIAFGPLSYGAANVGNLYTAISDDEADAVLAAAWECGIRSYDTAPHYGLGLSERRLGRFLATKPRSEYVVSTKVGRLLRPHPEGSGRLDVENGFAVPADTKRVWDFTRDGVRRGLEESLDRLGLDHVDVLYLHDPEEHDLEPSLATGLPAVCELRDEGTVTAVGVGSKSTAALLAAVRTGAVDLLMVAGRFTLLEQPALDEVIPACREQRVGIVSAAVFNSGVLASPEVTTTSRYEYGQVPPPVLERARAIAGVCGEYGVELPAAALQYPLREPAVRTVVAGAATPHQVRQNARRMRARVPDALWDRLREEGLVAA